MKKKNYLGKKFLISHNSLAYDRKRSGEKYRGIGDNKYKNQVKFVFFRLLMKTNLVVRDIISLDQAHCATGCGGDESAQHLFLSCDIFGSPWPLVREWIGFSTTDASGLSDHFVQFTYSASGLRARRSFLQLVWLACLRTQL
jgi:hypothetical protein